MVILRRHPQSFLCQILPRYVLLHFLELFLRCISAVLGYMPVFLYNFSIITQDMCRCKWYSLNRTMIELKMMWCCTSMWLIRPNTFCTRFRLTTGPAFLPETTCSPPYIAQKIYFRVSEDEAGRLIENRTECKLYAAEQHLNNLKRARTERQ